MSVLNTQTAANNITEALNISYDSNIQSTLITPGSGITFERGDSDSVVTCYYNKNKYDEYTPIYKLDVSAQYEKACECIEKIENMISDVLHDNEYMKDPSGEYLSFINKIRKLINKQKENIYAA